MDLEARVCSMRMEVYVNDFIKSEGEIDEWRWDEFNNFTYRYVNTNYFHEYSKELFYSTIKHIKITDGELEYYAYRGSDEELLKLKIKTFYQIIKETK